MRLNTWGVIHSDFPLKSKKKTKTKGGGIIKWTWVRLLLEYMSMQSDVGPLNGTLYTQTTDFVVDCKGPCVNPRVLFQGGSLQKLFAGGVLTQGLLTRLFSISRISFGRLINLNQHVHRQHLQCGWPRAVTASLILDMSRRGNRNNLPSRHTTATNPQGGGGGVMGVGMFDSPSFLVLGSFAHTIVLWN